MNRRIITHVLLGVSLLSLSINPADAAPPVVTVGEPDVGSKPKNQADYKALEKWLMTSQEKELATSNQIFLRTKQSVDDAIKNKTKVPPAKFVALANIVVLSVEKPKGEEGKDIFEVFEDKDGDLRVPDGRGGGPAIGKPYMLDWSMKLVDIRTSEIKAVTSKSFKGTKWNGWPDAKKIDSPELLNEETPKKLAKAIKDSCQDLIKQLSENNKESVE